MPSPEIEPVSAEAPALTGPYRRFDSHDEAFRAFVGKVEEAFEHEVDTYVTEVAREREQDRSQGATTRIVEPPPRRG